MSLFGGDARDLLALAEDEARMLGCTKVRPEHLLLAFSRRDPLKDLLGERRLGAPDLHAAIVGAGGRGDELVLGRLPWSLASEELLQQAVRLAAERGDRQPGAVHVILALAGDDRARAILYQVGIDDLEELVTERCPRRRDPRSEEQVRRELVRAALNEGTPGARAGACAPLPAFERFAPATRRAIRAAAESAACLEHAEVDPFHLLLGCLQVPESFAGRILAREWEDGELGAIGEAMDLACRFGPAPSHQATGTFSESARRVVAEDALKLAFRLGHDRVGSGHLLIAALDSRDRTTELMTRPFAQRLLRTLTRGLPGFDPEDHEGELDWIRFDYLVRIFIWGFRRVLPPAWTVRGSARSDIHLCVPESRSESDYQVRPGWIVSEPGTAPERLRRVTQWTLERLQAAVMDNTHQPWPGVPGEPIATAQAELIPDRFNPNLRLWYGSGGSAVLQPFEHELQLNMLIGAL